MHCSRVCLSLGFVAPLTLVFQDIGAKEVIDIIIMTMLMEKCNKIHFEFGKINMHGLNKIDVTCWCNRTSL